MQNTQEIWDTMKRPNIRIIGIEGEETQLKNSENVFNKVIKENSLNLNNHMYIKIHEAYRTTNRLGQRRKSPQHIIFKTLYIQDKEY